MRPWVRRSMVGLLIVAALAATADPAVAAMQTGPGRTPPPPGDAPALEAALVELRSLEVAGGWGTWDGPGTLRPGDVDPSVTALRLRLERSGDLLQGDAAPGPVVPDPGGAGAVASLEGGPGSPMEYDARLEGAVRRFQHRHGLDVDGIVGPATRRALNVTVAQRIRQVEHNLHLRSTFAMEPGPMAVLVNIPAFLAWVFQEGEDPAEHRVIVGRVDRPTPILSGRIQHVVLAPFWNVPSGILLRDKLPILRRDPAYLDRQRMTVMDRRTGVPVPPGEVDWATIPGSEFNRRYWLRQAPGPGNALGAVKFIFPNPYDVYLHDTPDRHLFERGRRAFSSGCMRLDRPLELAERLLASVPGWGSDRMHRVIDAGVETWVRISDGVPIHLVYWTAWVAGDGTLHLHEDLYGHGDGDRATDPWLGSAGGSVPGGEPPLSECATL